VTFHFPLDNLAQDLYDVVAWNLFILLFQWCFALVPWDGTIGYNETWIQFTYLYQNENYIGKLYWKMH
jgi:hypothetical protein